MESGDAATEHTGRSRHDTVLPLRQSMRAPGIPLWCGLGLLLRRGAITFLLFQIQLWRIRERNPAVCLHTFLSNHWVGMVIWLGAVVALAGSR